MIWILFLHATSLIYSSVSAAFTNHYFLTPQQQRAALKIYSSKDTQDDSCSGSVLTKPSRRKNLTWEESYRLLCEYKQVHGNCNVPQSHKPLGSFVNRQRIEHSRFIDPECNKTTPMTPERIDLLEQIGFVWDIVEHTWNIRYNELCQFRAKNGHAVVPRSHGRLGAWVEKQRIEYKKYQLLNEHVEGSISKPKGDLPRTTMTKERIQKLNDIDFVYDVREKQFEENVGELRIFFAKHKHLDPRFMDGKLASWVRKMKHQYQKYIMAQNAYPSNATKILEILPQRRLQALESAGFTPSMFNEIQKPIVTHRASWDERYEELVEFKNEHGHTVVPKSYGSLGSWVRAQRHLMNRDGPMAQDRIALLNELDFVWDVHQWQWNQTYHELLQWKIIHNHTNVPMSQGALGLWVSNQRAHYHNYRQGKPSHMTQSRAEQLRSTGFEFYPGKKRLASVDEKWYLRFVELKRYHDANGTCSIKASENPSLYYWCQHQKACYRKKLQGKKSPLKKSREEALQSIGFFNDISHE